MQDSSSFKEWLENEKAKGADGSVRQRQNEVGWAFWSTPKEEKIDDDLEEGRRNVYMNGCSLSRMDRFKYFLGLISLSAIFFLLAFILGIPLIMIRPAKFAISFTMGTLLFMAAFLLYNPSYFFRFFQKDKVIYTAVYSFTILATLYSSLFLKSYSLTLFLSVFQVIMMVLVTCTLFPLGQVGLRLAYQFMKQCCSMLQAVCSAGS